MALQNDGKIIMAGFVKYPEEWGLIRYNSNGTINGSFGVAGQVITSVGGSDELRSMVLQTDGKILVVGNSDSSFAVARYNIGLGNGIGYEHTSSDCLSVFPNPSNNEITFLSNFTVKKSFFGFNFSAASSAEIKLY